jgi:hypothetical protein
VDETIASSYSNGILFPGGFAYDYEYTTCALEMVHYGFWGNMGECVNFQDYRPGIV